VNPSDGGLYCRWLASKPCTVIRKVPKSSTAVQNRIKLRMRDKNTVRDVIQPDKLSDIVTSFFNRSQLANYPSQSNPISFVFSSPRRPSYSEPNQAELIMPSFMHSSLASSPRRVGDPRRVKMVDDRGVVR